jgi:hypothetical protein
MEPVVQIGGMWGNSELIHVVEHWELWPSTGHGRNQKHHGDQKKRPQP